VNNTFYRFNIGKFECTVIHDGILMIPDTIHKKPFNPLDPNSGIAIDVLSLLINTGEHRVLMDTGCGVGKSTAGKLLPNMKLAGINSADIDIVIITHAHSDHIGGNTDAGGKPAFPNARYIIHRKEWEYWMNRIETEKGSQDFFLNEPRKNLPPLKDVVEFIEDGADILPGIKVVEAIGHTPGHILLSVSSGTDKLLCLADIMHHEMEMVIPDLFTIFDINPQEAIRMRNQVLPGVESTGVLAYLCHLPFPGLGHIVRKEDKFAWQPLCH
jgi:glyoxylase-like metal-dependent hydrolase (beta-lactamase superfamily II)